MDKIFEEIEDFEKYSYETFDYLFKQAKEKDEFEYVCSLLRIAGMSSAGWDPLVETNDLVMDMTRLLQAPLEKKTRIRLALLVYCHITEVDAIYNIIENMLRTTEGLRCSIAPFENLYIKKSLFESIPPSAKKVVNFLREHAEKLGQKKLCNILENMFDDVVRNSFFHSDYTIHDDDEYRTKEGKFKKDGLITSSIKLVELEKTINCGLLFYQSFINCFKCHRLSYKESKKVLAKIMPDGSTKEVELLVHPTGGVYGFKG